MEFENRMNVLEVISSLDTVGGAETFAVSLSKALRNLCNLKVVILYNSNNVDLINKLKSSGIEPIILNKKRGYDYSIIIKLRKIIIENKIQYIHTENNALISTFYACQQELKKGSIKLLHTLHTEPGKEGGRLNSYLMKKILHFKNILPVEIALDNLPKSKKYYGLTDIPVIDNGVDTDMFYNEITLENRINDVVVFARFEKQKNHYFLLNIFEKCHTIYPLLKVRLYGMGSLRAAVIDRIKTMNAQDYILTPGLLDRDGVVEVLKNTKISVLASFWEGNSISVLESLAAGCVPILSAVGGNLTVIQNGYNGFLFDLNDMDGFATKIVDILIAPEKFNYVRQNAIYSSRQYSINETARKYIDLFNDFQHRH